MITTSKLFLHMIRTVLLIGCTNLLPAPHENNHSSCNTKLMDLASKHYHHNSKLFLHMLNIDPLKHYTNLLLRETHYKNSNYNTNLKDSILPLLEDPLDYKPVLHIANIDNHVNYTSHLLELLRYIHSSYNRNLVQGDQDLNHQNHLHSSVHQHQKHFELFEHMLGDMSLFHKLIEDCPMSNPMS